MTGNKPRILFLCTGNSCRSQMAEGWANFLGRDLLEARSAGIEAHGKNPRALAVMREAGVDISHQESKKLTPELLAWADRVVTVCGHADEHCPALPAPIPKQHWPLDDPAKATGTDEQIMDTFRATCAEVLGRVKDLVGELSSGKTWVGHGG